MSDKGVPDGFHYESPGISATASNQTVSLIADHVVTIWDASLAWASGNELEFFGVLLLLAFALVQRRIRKVDTVRCKLEYADERAKAKSEHSGANIAPPSPLRVEHHHGREAR